MIGNFAANRGRPHWSDAVRSSLCLKQSTKTKIAQANDAPLRCPSPLALFPALWHAERRTVPLFPTQLFVTRTAPFLGQEDSMRAASAECRRGPAVREHPEWGELLLQAVNIPGVISDAYSRFWNYS